MHGDVDWVLADGLRNTPCRAAEFPDSEKAPGI